jgi:hypothetical protein
MTFLVIGLNVTCVGIIVGEQTYMFKQICHALTKRNLQHAKVFSTLDLHFSYHQLPYKEGDKVKISFWGINRHGKDFLYQWWFFPILIEELLSKCILLCPFFLVS